MKVHFACFEDGIVATGFRKMAAYARSLEGDTKVSFVTTRKQKSLTRYLFNSKVGSALAPDLEVVNEVAAELAKADLIGLSSMTGYAAITRAVIKRIREISKHPFIIWGGIHPIIQPLDAIESDVDAVCVGEGEFAFREFFERFSSGKDFLKTRNFWFNYKGNQIKNAFLPLMTNAEMETLPFQLYREGETIFDRRCGFRPMTEGDYLTHEALAYSALWSIGCPFHCTFCGNTAFIANDENYKKIRHPTAQYMISEIQSVLKKHPFISQVAFFDDSFMAIPVAEIEQFAALWKAQVELPFAVYGVIPNYVTEKKMRILSEAGMSQVRMGIQSGSQRILDFYQRPTPLAKIQRAAETLSTFAKNGLPPMYDIIVDNPLETREDILATLDLVYGLARPFFLNIYALRIIPNTKMAQDVKNLGVKVPLINDGFYGLRPCYSNALLYLLCFWRPPRYLFEKFKGLVGNERHLIARCLLTGLFRWVSFIVRGIYHVRHLDFTFFGGKPSYFVWKFGIVNLMNKKSPNRPGLSKRQSPSFGVLKEFFSVRVLKYLG